MVKTIEIGEKKLKINSAAGWFYCYRRQFGRDILPDILPVIESILAAFASLLPKAMDGGKITEAVLFEAMQDDDLFDAFIKISGMEITTVYNIIWAMANNADRSIGDPEEFFNEFENLPMDELLPEIFTIIVESSVSSKNSKRLLQTIKKVKKNQ